MSNQHLQKSCFVVSIDLSLQEKLKNDLISQGFEISVPANTIFSARKSGISLSLYHSGKLTVQGKEKGEFITFYLEPEILQNLSYSYPESKEIDFTPRIGVDESGKGDFFGPLCIAGVQADEKGIKLLSLLNVKDSKQISDPSILKLSKEIKKSVPHTIIRISPQKYNTLYSQFHNLNHLLAWGHATAISELAKKTDCKEALIDQFTKEPLVKRALKQKNIDDIHLQERPRAEEDVVVAAASIIARGAFLEELEKLSILLSYPLPKGASQKVIEAGKALVSKHGEKVLEIAAKLHFKTTQQILNA